MINANLMVEGATTQTQTLGKAIASPTGILVQIPGTAKAAHATTDQTLVSLARSLQGAKVQEERRFYEGGQEAEEDPEA